MKVSIGARLVTCLLCALSLVSCSGTAGTPTPTQTPEITGPSIQLQDAVERLNTYTLRIENEVLAPDAKAISSYYSDKPIQATVEDSSPSPAPCEGVGKIASTSFIISGGKDSTTYGSLRKWLTANGFRLTERTANGDRITDGRTTDGFTVVATLSVGVEVAFTAPCGWPASIPGGPTKPLPKATPKTVLEARSPELACRQPAQYVVSPNAPPYRGAGPHLIAIATLLPENTQETGLYVPDTWDPRLGDSGEIDKRRVQLIACVTGTPAGDSHEITCQYDEPEPKTLTVLLHEATYDVVVRTARTGQKVAAFSIRGTAPDAGSCPAYFVHNTFTELLRGADTAAFQAKLRPLVTARR